MARNPTFAGYVDSSVEWVGDGFGTLIDAVLELVPELTWPLSIRTYSRMRWDPQLAAIAKAYTLPIRRSDWSIDPQGARPEVAQQVAEDLGLPVLGKTDEQTGARRRGVNFAEHLRLALLALTFGHMPFEQLWSQDDNGRFRLAALSERMPQTIDSIKIDDQGQIVSVQQFRRANSAEPVVIPARNLVWYANDREGAAWFGQSLLRPSFPLWLIKDDMLRVHATSIRRFGMGLPYVEAPPGATPQQVAEAQRLAANWKGSEHSGAGLPNGFKLALAGMTGSVPDAVAFITYLDQQMTRSTLSSILDMATTQRGTRALGEVILDVFTLGLQAIADELANTMTQKIVVPLVTANYGEDEPCPIVTCGDVGAEHSLTAEALNQLFQYGAITPDANTENAVRSLYNLPARTGPYVQPHIETPTSQPTSRPVAAAAADGTATSEQSQQAQGRLAALFAAGLSASALSAAVVTTLAGLGISAATADAVLAMVGTPPAGSGLTAIGAAARATAAAEPAARAAYLIAAAHRVQSAVSAGTPLTDALAGEARYYGQHLNAQAARASAASQVDATAAAQGSDTLGWNAVMDDATSPDCAALDGLNFTVDSPPPMGWPGAVHPNCRCTAGPAHAGAGFIGGEQLQEATG